MNVPMRNFSLHLYFVLRHIFYRLFWWSACEVLWACNVFNDMFCGSVCRCLCGWSVISVYFCCVSCLTFVFYIEFRVYMSMYMYRNKACTMGQTDKASCMELNFRSYQLFKKIGCIVMLELIMNHAQTASSLNPFTARPFCAEATFVYFCWMIYTFK